MTEFNNGEEACFLNDFLCQINGGSGVFPAQTPLAGLCCRIRSSRISMMRPLRSRTARCSKTSISRLSEVHDNERE